MNEKFEDMEDGRGSLSVTPWVYRLIKSQALLVKTYQIKSHRRINLLHLNEDASAQLDIIIFVMRYSPEKVLVVLFSFTKIICRNLCC